MIMADVESDRLRVRAAWGGTCGGRMLNCFCVQRLDQYLESRILLVLLLKYIPPLFGSAPLCARAAHASMSHESTPFLPFICTRLPTAVLPTTVSDVVEHSELDLDVLSMEVGADLLTEAGFAAAFTHYSVGGNR